MNHSSFFHLTLCYNEGKTTYKGGCQMLLMDDIIREGNPTLREEAEDVALPLSDEDIQTGRDMMEFLINSQDPEMIEKYDLRSGVGIAAPQIDVSKKILAVLIPSIEPGHEDEISFQEVMYNPKIVSHSVQMAALSDGEGCLSVDRPVEGLVPRPQRVTLEWTDINGEHHKKRFKNYEAIVLQHEMDHLHGVLFVDRVDPKAAINQKDLTII